MFNDTITIYNLVEEKMYRKVVNNVFVNNKTIISQEGKGEKFTSAHDVIFSDIAIRDYLEYGDYKKLGNKENNFTLKVNDVIVIGEFKEVENLSEIQKSDKEYFLIKSISKNLYGAADLQNIEVTD